MLVGRRPRPAKRCMVPKYIDSWDFEIAFPKQIRRVRFADLSGHEVDRRQLLGRTSVAFFEMLHSGLRPELKKGEIIVSHVGKVERAPVVGQMILAFYEHPFTYDEPEEGMPTYGLIAGKVLAVEERDAPPPEAYIYGDDDDASQRWLRLRLRVAYGTVNELTFEWVSEDDWYPIVGAIEPRK